MDKAKMVEQLLWLAASTMFWVANILSTYILFHGGKK